MKNQILKLLLIVAVFHSIAAAQFTTVTGTVIDPHNIPYALGTITPLLIIPSGAGSPTLNGNPYSPPSNAVNLDKSGHFAFNVGDNTALLPAGTKWNFVVCSATGTVQPAIGTGPQCFTLAAAITISGSTQDISTQLNAVSLALTVPIGSSGGCTPTGTNAIQYNNAGACAGITNVAAGSELVSNGSSNVPVYLNYPIFDSRTFTGQAGTVCNGTNDNTTGLLSAVQKIGSQQATLRMVVDSSNPGPCNLTSNFVIPANIHLDSSGGGAFKLVSSSTPTGGMTPDDSGSGANFNTSSTSCTVTVTPTAPGESYILYTAFGFGSGAKVASQPTSSQASDIVLFTPAFTGNINVSMLTDAWLLSNVVGGSRTFTFTYTSATWNACGARAVAGGGPVIVVGASGSTQGTTSPMTSGAVTTVAGDFLFAFGGQHNNTETCTATGGFTQPAGSIGQVGTNGTVCTMQINSSAGGSVTANQTISSAPTGLAWTYALLAIRPGSPTLNILGGFSDPDNHQVFVNANPSLGQGTVDFTGNLLPIQIRPQFWGAIPGFVATAHNNTGPLQSSEYAALGINRTNASGLQIYNKELYLSGIFQIDGPWQWYHTIGTRTARWRMDCAPGGGVYQTATNTRIIDGQSNAYGNILNCVWGDSADSTDGLVVWDFNGVTTAGDLAEQFITMIDNSFVGDGADDVGLLIAPSGGGSQGSNIGCIGNCSGQGFSGAVVQVGGNGIGRNAGRSYATNALNVRWEGDMQNCPNIGFANYGGGYEIIDNSSFECVSPWANFLTSLSTAVDVYSEASQGPFVYQNTRSEDLNLIHASHPVVRNSQNIDQSTAFYSPVNCLAGGSEPLHWFIHPSDVGGDGALYQVTVHGTAFGGLCLTNASSGTSTTISDTNQRVAGAQTIGTFVSVCCETVTQAVTGSTATLLNIPVSTGTITGSVTSVTIAVGDTVTQAGTGITCTVVSPAPTGSGNLLVKACSGTANNSGVWTDGGTGGTYTPATAPSFAPASPVMLITAATGSPDSSHNWTGGTSGAVLVPSAAPVNDVNWTVNQFATSAPGQQQVTIFGGTGAGITCGPITSNTATQITFTTCGTNYFNVHATTFTNQSQFIVEPCTSPALSGVCTQPITQSGDFTLSKVSPVIIGGDSSGQSGECIIEDSVASAGLIGCFGSEGKFTRIQNVQVSRQDWYQTTGGFTLSSAVITQFQNQIIVQRPYSGVSGAGIVWTINDRNGNTNVYAGPVQMRMGTSAIVTSVGTSQGGRTGNEVAFATRSDPDGQTSTFRNRFEVCNQWTGTSGASANPICSNATFGAPLPQPFNMTDVAGGHTQIAQGGSTGAGLPGPIDFVCGNVGSSGTTVNDGTTCWSIDTSGNLTDQGTHTITPSLYATKTNCAQSGTAANPSVVSCTAAAAGAFACNVAASAGTCVVNTTAVGANSQIIVQETTKENTRLGVTCNTSPTVIPAIMVASQVAGTSFTINMPTITTNPACFDYWIVNQ